MASATAWAKENKIHNSKISLMLPKLVITDIDGVWTDGGMYYSAEGDIMKRFSVKDGWGVIFLRELGIPVAIMTGRTPNWCRSVPTN